MNMKRSASGNIPTLEDIDEFVKEVNLDMAEHEGMPPKRVSLKNKEKHGKSKSGR